MSGLDDPFVFPIKDATGDGINKEKRESILEDSKKGDLINL